VKNHNLNDLIDLFEKNQKLPHKSERKYIGFFLDFLRKIFTPIFEFFLGARLETQRKANLAILKEIIELKNYTKENFENFQKNFEEFKTSIVKNFEEIQKEVLYLRDEKIPALKDALALGLEGVDRKAEYALSNLIVIKQAIEKGITLSEEEKRALKETLTSLKFMEKFRGNEEEIKKRQAVYIEKLKNFKNVVDLGCGRGEFLQLLKENSIPSFGVEIEPSLCAILKEKNLNFFQMNIFDFLEKKPIEFDCLVSFHLIEHLNLKEALALLKLAYFNLPKDGIFVIETPNPTSLFSFLNFYKDPEHKTPWHPETLKFFAEETGFYVLEEIYLEELKGVEILQVPEGLKKLIYGPQDYGIILKKP